MNAGPEDENKYQRPQDETFPHNRFHVFRF
jgi:hypothetical protein